MLNDWYELLDKQSLGGQQILNVYHVERVDAGVTAEIVFNAFEFSIAAAMFNTQPEGLLHDSVSVRNLGNAFDFFEGTLFPNEGSRVGQALTQFNAAAIQFNRLRLDMKNGQKRWVAGVEVDANGAVWVAAFLPTLETLGTSLVTTWRIFGAPEVEVCRFGIIQRVCKVQPPPSPCPSYRLPETDEELEFYIPTTFIVRETVRSQVSRKRLV